MFSDTTDGPVASDQVKISVKSHVYRVRAIKVIGNFSSYSNIPRDTAISFEDNQLEARATSINAQHLCQP